MLRLDGFAPSSLTIINKQITLYTIQTVVFGDVSLTSISKILLHCVVQLVTVKAID